MKESNLSEKVGMPPGSLIYIGDEQKKKSKVSVIDFNSNEYNEKVINHLKDCASYIHSKDVSWVNVEGLTDIDTIKEIGEIFDLHPLLLEDILNTNTRPKLEEFDNYTFLSMKILKVNKNLKSINYKQISFVVGKTWIISFQESETTIFNNLKKRIKEAKGNTRNKGNDYLLYRLIDTIVDNYFIITEFISDISDKLEDKVLTDPDKNSLSQIQTLKKALFKLRKTINPMRDIVNQLHNDSTFIKEDTKRYLRDVYEHIVHLNENIDMQRDISSGIMEMYQSGVSNKMNQVMQVLTIMSTIFIPLTFLAGIYGMNFKNIPELEWEHGYYFILVIMLLIVIYMIFFFKRKKWI